MLHEQLKNRAKHITGRRQPYDSADIVAAARALNVTPHVNRNDHRCRSNFDGRTVRNRGDGISLSRRWLVEEAFGWLKRA